MPKAPAKLSRRFAPTLIFLGFFSLCLFIAPAFSQQRVEVYPKAIRLDKGKTRTITAVAFNADGTYMPNQNFTFTRETGSGSTASIRKSPEGNTEENNSRLSPNLAEIAGLASGNVTFVASLNGVVSNSVSVVVADPAEMPIAVIRGDNEAEGNMVIRAAVGEAIEVNADSSRGVKLPEWFWGDGDRTSDIFSATHAYLSPGSYTLRLRVTNSGGQIADSQITVIVSDFASPTRTFTVTTAAQLLNAYNQCVGGEHIIIPAGTIITGSITLPARNFTDFVTIRSSAAMPDMRVRVDPAQSDLAVIRADGINELPLQIKNRANKIRLSGIKFEPYPGTPETAQNYYLLQIGEAFAQATDADNPTKIIVDHCVIRPPDNIQVVHAVLNDGYKVSIISSWFGNIKTYGSQDSQAVFGLDGRGAHVYNNTYFEAASESIMYGGADNRVNGMVPTNIEFRRCSFSKPVAWRQLPALSNGSTLNEKNLFEIKNARRVYVEGSVFSNHWDALRSQYYAITLKSAADSPGSGQGSAWSVAEEIVLENNRISHVNGGVAVVRDFFYPGRTYDTLKPQHIRIINTLFDDLTSGRWGANRTWTFFMGGVDDLLVDHVSVIDTIESQTDSPELLLYINSINSYRPEITDSILPLNTYGIRNTCGEGLTALNVGTSGWFDPTTSGSCGAASGSNAGAWKIEGNILPKLRSYHNPALYPANNSYPENYEGIGMNSYRTCGASAAADPCDSPIVSYALRPDSQYKRQAGDGGDPGIDSVLLNDRVQCTTLGDTRGCLTGGQIVPTTTPTPTPSPTPTPVATPSPTPSPVPSPTPNPSPTPTPSNIGAFPGPIPAKLPGTIEAENFDRGGEGTGYHELFGTTGSSVYRNAPVESVSVQARSTASGGFAVFEAAAGEWLNYTVDIPTGGYFLISFRYASEFYGGTFHLEIDGQDITGPITVESTGSWATYQAVARRTRVGMGRHQLRLVMDTNSVNPQTLTVSPVVCNIDSIVFAAVRKT